MSSHRIWPMVGGAGATVFLLFLPKILSEVHINLAIEVYIFALYAVSLNLLWGYGGMLPFGHGAFFGVGAYTAGLIFNHIPNMPLLLTLLMAALSGLVAGMLIGFFCVRLKGAYFALISLAFQMFLFALAWKWRDVTRGDDGMGIVRPALQFPGLGSISMMNINNLYYFVLIIVALGLLACYLFLKTPLGNSVVCMRENDLRASFLGYRVFLTKFTVFSFSGIFAGVAGALFVLFTEFMGTNSIDINMSISALFMVLIGGAGHFLGPVLGAAFYMVFQDRISSLTSHWWLIMGVFYVVVILYLKGGLISLLQAEKIRFWQKGRVEEENEKNTEIRESI